MLDKCSYLLPFLISFWFLSSVSLICSSFWFSVGLKNLNEDSILSSTSLPCMCAAEWQDLSAVAGMCSAGSPFLLNHRRCGEEHLVGSCPSVLSPVLPRVLYQHPVSCFFGDAAGPLLAVGVLLSPVCVYSLKCRQLLIITSTRRSELRT